MEIHILLQTCGPINFDIVNRLVSDIRELLNVNVEASTESLVPPLIYFDWARQQYFADRILEWIYRKFSAFKYDKILCLCNFDAYVKPLNFVFGLADPIKGIALVFIPRLKPEFYGGKSNYEKLYHRIVKESLHELGHTFGLTHCANRKCVMNFSNSIYDVDFKRAAYCVNCANKLKEVGIILSNHAKLFE